MTVSLQCDRSNCARLTAEYGLLRSGPVYAERAGCDTARACAFPTLCSNAVSRSSRSNLASISNPATRERRTNSASSKGSMATPTATPDDSNLDAPQSTASGLIPTFKGNKLHIPTFACGRCHKPSNQPGRGYRMILGARVQVCAGCKGIIDAQRARVVA